jgi:hypothetical protein
MDELKAAIEAGERKAFEAWISAPPFEQNVRRYSDNPQTAAWPGNYREYNVQLAWCAWEARAAQQRPCRGVAQPGCNYLAACGSVCNKCGQAT